MMNYVIFVHQVERYEILNQNAGLDLSKGNLVQSGV